MKNGAKGSRNKQKGPNSKRRGYKRQDSERTDTTRSSDRDFNRKTGELSSLNDISWYARYPDLLRVSASLPFPYKAGMSISDMGTFNSSGTTTPDYSKNNAYNIPGVLAIRFIPSIGISANTTDPASIACKELYARVRKSYSGSLEADPPDFLIYLLALDSIFSYIGSLKRIFRLVNAFTPYNYVVPDTLLNALGVTPTCVSNLRKDKLKFMGQINELIYMTHNLVCPAVMDIFNRHYWMNDNAYADSPSPNSQIYVFRQDAYYKYAEQKTPADVDAAGLAMTPAPLDTATTSDDLYAFGLALIRALSSWDDAYTISGYLMRAFEGVPSFGVDLLTGTEEFVLQYQEEVLAQIENANVGFMMAFATLKTVLATGDLNVSQDPTNNRILSGMTIQNPPSGVLSYTMGYFGDIPMLSVRNDAPTPEDVVLATRLKTHYSVLSNGAVQIHCGTECVVAYELWSKSGTSADFVTDGYESDNTRATFLAPFAAFDWAPLIRINWRRNVSGSYQNNIQLLWDVHNLTPVTLSQLDEINRVCIYSEFNAFNA